MKKILLLALGLVMFGCEEYGLEDYDLLLEDNRYELISEHEGTDEGEDVAYWWILDTKTGRVCYQLIQEGTWREGSDHCSRTVGEHLEDPETGNEEG
jgi:hypothetical protein|tara:strand:+ start:219 stop:509 length:291 start_codon:yes stop_codon:yes gene_type:complete